MFVWSPVENEWRKQLKPAIEGLGKHCKFPSGIRGGATAKTIFLCFIKLWESHWWQSFWIFWRACCHNTVPLSLIRSTVTASVRRQKGDRNRLGPPLNPPMLSMNQWSGQDWGYSNKRFVIIMNLRVYDSELYNSQDNTNVYMALEYVNGGELFSYMRLSGKLR